MGGASVVISERRDGQLHMYDGEQITVYAKRGNKRPAVRVGPDSNHVSVDLPRHEITVRNRRGTVKMVLH
jgi:hypothetical protein